MRRDHGLKETLVRSRPLYKGRSVNFNVDVIRLPNGKTATREYIDHPGAVAVIPFLDPRTIVMVEQFRHPIGRTTLEIPAGKLDEGETPLACVRRELGEETGYTARKVRRLLSFWPAPAFSNELLHIYRAEGLEPGDSRPDHDEFLRVRTVKVAAALRMVRDGRLQDAKTVISLLAHAAGLR